MKNLYNNIKIYYNDLDNLTKRLQDNWNDNVEFEQDEQDRLALCMVLDCFDQVEDNIIDVITNDFIVLEKADNESYQDLLIFDERLTLEEYKKIRDIVEETKKNKGNWYGFGVNDIVEEIRKYKPCRLLELVDDTIRRISY